MVKYSVSLLDPNRIGRKSKESHGCYMQTYEPDLYVRSHGCTVARPKDSRLQDDHDASEKECTSSVEVDYGSSIGYPNIYTASQAITLSDSIPCATSHTIVVQLMPCNKPASTFPHWKAFVKPAGDTTSTSSTRMFLQTFGLEQTTYPEYGERALLVVPSKFEIWTLLIVRFDGN